jgi:hypothetical protein
MRIRVVTAETNSLYATDRRTQFFTLNLDWMELRCSDLCRDEVPRWGRYRAGITGWPSYQKCVCALYVVFGSICKTPFTFQHTRILWSLERCFMENAQNERNRNNIPT